MDLLDRYASLPRPSRAGSYSVDRAPGFCRVGRSFEDHPAILVRFDDSSGLSVGRRLDNLAYSPATDVNIVRADGTTAPERLAILECPTTDGRLIGFFYRVVESILLEEAESGSEGRFEGTLDAVIALFRALRRPGRRTIQGLWAELAIIAWSKSPKAALASWHSSPNDLHDFSAGGMRLEVKSTVQPLREHTFSLEQVAHQGRSSTVVASLLLDEVAHGTTVPDLVLLIQERVGRSQEARRRLETIVIDSLGMAWTDVDEYRFDLTAARSSLRLYRAEAVPAIPQPIPMEIRSISYTVDFSTVPHTPLEELRRKGGLFEDLLPGSEE